MTNLESFYIKFESPLSRPRRESQRPPPPTRAVLPALTRFEFKGVSEYLEDFVARIDAPLLDSIEVACFHQLIFDTPRLAQFMGRTVRFQELKRVDVQFRHYSVRVETLPLSVTHDKMSGLEISCRELDWQLSSVAQVFTAFIPSIDIVEHLYIRDFRYQPRYESSYDIDILQWLEIFHRFTAVKNLNLSGESVHNIALALQELVGGRTMEVLPTLQSIFLEELQPSGRIPEGIEKFVAARQLSGHPITVSVWD